MVSSERRHVFYTGRVQGVGFRYSARRTADGFQVTGYVRNLPDGRVELIAEGEPVELGEFLNRLTEVMAPYITNTEVHNGEATGEFSGFEIRF